MYRSYEDSYKLNRMLEEAEENYQKLSDDGYGTEDLIDELLWIEELKERINRAWQDEEYDALNQG